jgi:uncharacterized protein (TIGR03790 family)
MSLALAGGSGRWQFRGKMFGAPLSRLRGWLCVAVCLWAAAVVAQADGSEVVVVYNRAVPESREVADHYAQKRGVPAAQLIGIQAPAHHWMTRAEYNRNIQDVLLAELEGRGLARFATQLAPATNQQPARTQYACTTARVRYLLLCYGVPYQITPDTTWVEATPAGTDSRLLRNEAAVDSELALLPMANQVFLSGPARNPFYGATNAAQMHPTNGVFLVSRLDGPSPAIAKGLVDKALLAETNGLGGYAYFDLRGITNGAYAEGDQFLELMATVAERLGYGTQRDRNEATLPASYPLGPIAIYGGWYAGDLNGPFLNDPVEFQPGAIAYHIHSYSASQLRSDKQGWAGPLLAKGAAVTMGCVFEPYLSASPNPGVFLERLGGLQFTVGEAGLAAMPVLSWQNIVVGDPLYRPFTRNVLELQKDLTASTNPALEWALLRKVNIYLLAGREQDVLRDYLIEQPITTHSAAICENVALLYYKEGRLGLASDWAQRALALSTSRPSL